MTFPLIWLSLLLAAAPLNAADPDNHNSWTEWIRRANSLHRDGRFQDAIESAKRALAIAKGTRPPDSRLDGAYFVLGSIYRDWGHCADARSGFVHALSAFEKQADAKPGLVFTAIVTLINTASECDEFDAAAKLYRDHRAALQRYRAGPFEDAKLLALQGTIARGRKRYAEAEDYFRRALQLMEQAPGAKADDIAETRGSMALMISHQGRYQESLAESERAIAELDRISPRYVTLPTLLNNEAYTLEELGRKEECTRMYQRSLNLARELFGEDNRRTANIMLNYAAFLRRNKQAPAAEAMRKEGTEAYHRAILHDSQTVDVGELAKTR